MTELSLSIQNHVTYHLKSYRFLTGFSNLILGLKAKFPGTTHIFFFFFPQEDECIH